MVKRVSGVLGAAAALAMTASSASAAIVFQDTFDGETAGTQTVSLTNFDITGSVDVITPANPHGIVVSSNAIDLDGSPGPGQLTSKNAISYQRSNLVDLTFRIGGAQRGSAGDNIFVSLFFDDPTGLQLFQGSGLFAFHPCPMPCAKSDTYTASAFVPGNMSFSNSRIRFRAKDVSNFKFAIGTTSGDSVGPLLDSVQVSVTAVPEPGTWALMIAGFGLAGAGLRRQKLSVA